MRREIKQEREAWTALVEGREPAKPNKYRAEREGKYPSKHHAEVAQKLWALERAGKIQDLREEVPFVMIKGRNGISGVTYIADFTYIDNDLTVVADAKGYKKNAVYVLKKRMMYLLCGITVEEL